MAKKVLAYIKLQVPAGQANPSPPVGPALGQHGVNIMEFCKAFNAKTQSMENGMPIPVIITVYADRSFSFITKTPPAAVLLRKAAGIPKGVFESKKLPIKNPKAPIKSGTAKIVYLKLNCCLCFIGFTSTISVKLRFKNAASPRLSHDIIAKGKNTIS